MVPVPELLIKKIWPSCSPLQLQQLFDFERLLNQYGEKFNLVSRFDLTRLWENHIYPSLIVRRLLEFPLPAPLVDLGSGGGLPAIPLKIMQPAAPFVLVEANRKKAAFLKKVLQEIDLKEVEVINTRLLPGQLSLLLPHSFEIMTVRAVASLEKLLPLAHWLIKPTGFLLAWKGESDLPEMKRLANREKIDFQVFQVPAEFYSISEKFSSLRLFKVWFTPED